MWTEWNFTFNTSPHPGLAAALEMSTPLVSFIKKITYYLPTLGRALDLKIHDLAKSKDSEINKLDVPPSHCPRKN